MDGEERSTEFLPPLPAGPEPELKPGDGRGPPGDEQPTQQTWQQPQRVWQPPAWQQPPPGYGYGYGYYPPPPAEPENGAAIAGFVTSVSAGALLIISGGLLGIVSAIAAPFGIYYSRKGKRAVDEGRTRKHRGLAKAGFIIGIVALVLSVIVTAAWVIAIIAAARNGDFDDDFDNGGGGGFDSTRVRAVLLSGRVALGLLG